LIGLKSLVNEFVAYAKLETLKGTLSRRSTIIATYALCGFSNPASVGIQISAFSTLAPERRQDFARLAFRAYIAGSMACFLTACVAGSLIA
jgi:nucleoside permease NupC